MNEQVGYLSEFKVDKTYDFQRICEELSYAYKIKFTFSKDTKNIDDFFKQLSTQSGLKFKRVGLDLEVTFND